MKKTLAALALAGSIALVGAGPAMATTPVPYPAPTADGNVDDGTVAPGQTFNFILTGFGPFESITITITLTGAPQAIGGNVTGGASMAVPVKVILPLAPASQTFNVTADANGNVTVPLTLSEEGTYTLTAVGASGKTVTSTVTVDASAGAGSGLANTGGSAALANTGTGLANTGADSGLVLWTIVGAGALAAGAASVVVVRRRAKSETAA
jgi:LPXTG-motif cell wall-anchored protein